MKLRIKEARERAEYTQTELASLIGVAPNTFCGYENGLHDPKSKLLIKIAKECDTTTDYLLGLVDDPTPFPDNRKSPTPEGAEDHISMEESNRLFDALVNAGLIDDAMNFSDADRAFLSHIIGLLGTWTQSKRK